MTLPDDPEIGEVSVNTSCMSCNPHGIGGDEEQSVFLSDTTPEFQRYLKALEALGEMCGAIRHTGDWDEGQESLFAEVQAAKEALA